MPKLVAAFEKGLPHKVAADKQGQLVFFGFTEVGEQPCGEVGIPSAWWGPAGLILLAQQPRPSTKQIVFLLEQTSLVLCRHAEQRD